MICVHVYFFLYVCLGVFCILISLSCQEVEPAQREAYWGKMCQQFLFNTSLLKGKFVSQRACVQSRNAVFLGREEPFTQ